MNRRFRSSSWLAGDDKEGRTFFMPFATLHACKHWAASLAVIYTGFCGWFWIRKFGEPRMKLGITTLAIWACIFTPTCVLAADAPPQVTTDGLHLINGTQVARVYVKPGVDLSRYNRILIGKPVVAFTSGWQDRQNSIPRRTVTNEDMQRMKGDLAELFISTFKQELEQGGYAITDEFGDDVLIIRPAIIDLDVIAPDTPGTRNERSMIASAGSMTLYMELVDSVTGDRLVKAIDNKYDRTQTSRRSNRTRNETAARELLGEWAALLRRALDEARVLVDGN